MQDTGLVSAYAFDAIPGVEDCLISTWARKAKRKLSAGNHKRCGAACS